MPDEDPHDEDGGEREVDRRHFLPAAKHPLNVDSQDVARVEHVGAQLAHLDLTEFPSLGQIAPQDRALDVGPFEATVGF